MADAILQQVKVDRNDAYFAWVKGLEIKWGDNILSANKRNDEFNAIIYLAVMDLMREMGNAVANLDPIQFLTRASVRMPYIFAQYCQIALIQKGVVIDATIQENLNKKISSKKLDGVFQQWTLQRLQSNPQPFALDSGIRLYSFGENIEDKFINGFIQEFIPLETNISNVVELKPATIVCGCTLVKLISKKEHSQVWEAQRRGRKIALKFEHIDIEEKSIKKMIGASSFEKILEHIKMTDIEYLNYIKLKDYPYKMNFFDIEYFHPLRMKVKIMSWLDGPVDKVTIEDKKTFIYALYDIIYELHKRGLMFNGFRPSHIMIKPHTVGEEIPVSVKSNYRIVDYKYITEFKGSNIDLHSTYLSLALLSGSPSVSPYDDIESMLYTINDIIATKVLYVDKQDEYIKKTELSPYSSLISNAINSLRTLKQQDIYVNGLHKPADYPSYITEIYEKGLSAGGMGSVTDPNYISSSTMIPGIRTIIGNIFASYNEVSAIEISLVAPDFELLKKIKNNVVNSTDHMFVNLRSDPTKTNEVCLAILNYQITGYTPTLEFQPYITKYFSY